MPPRQGTAKAAAERKRVTPRGPSAARPKTALRPTNKNVVPKIRDDERVHNLVYAILSAWKADTDPAVSAGIIKVSRRKIEGALRDLKNTRFTKIPALISDILTGSAICDEFGMWVYVEHDSPDWIFMRLPEDSTRVIRADICPDRTGETSAAVTTSSEVLLEDTRDEPAEMLDLDERDIEDLETKAMRKELIDRGIIKPEAADKLHRPDLMKLLAYYA